METKPKTDKKGDWSIDELYSKSWQIVKNNKVTWIFGVAVLTTAFSLNSNLRSFNLPTGDFSKIFYNFPAGNLEKTSKVLGASTNNPFEPIFNIFVNIPPYLYVILGIEILITILVSLLIIIIYRAWSKGSLIQSIQLAYESKNVSIRDSSENAFKSVKSIIWLDIIPPLILFLVALPFIIVTGIMIFGIFSWGFSPWIFWPLFVIFLLSLLVVSIFISMSVLWGLRVIVVDGKPAKEGFLAGFKIARKKFWSTIGLGILNFFLGTAVSLGFIIALFLFLGIVIGIPAGILIATGVVKFNDPATLINIIPFLAIPVFIIVTVIILVTTLIWGIFESFKTSVWTVAYNKIKGKYA